MSVLKRRSAGAWHDSIASAGLAARRPARAPANDNRAAGAPRRGSVLKAAGLIGLGLAGALATALAFAW
ncbi:MAG TPA: hypothetical protein VHL98_06785 [Microvirga sp.]|jgi:hypothetical protein|nr:hypothetical protein [Microvirga sp.]